MFNRAVAMTLLLAAACGEDSPQQSPLTGVVEVTAGAAHACARLSAGGVACWGANSEGQVGVAQAGSWTQSQAVVLPAVAGATAVAAGVASTCAILNGGSVACWGSNSDTALGVTLPPDVRSSHAPVFVPGVVGASSLATLGPAATSDRSPEGACAIVGDGRAMCWGAVAPEVPVEAPPFRAHPPVPLPGLANATSVALGIHGWRGCALQKDATVACWGVGTSNGQVGELGFPLPSDTPLAVPGLAGVTALVATSFRTCALREQGDVVCWETSSSSTMGPTPPTGALAPLQNVEGFSDITAIAASVFDLYGVTRSGRVVRARNIVREPTEVVAGIEDAVSVAAGQSFACALTRAGTVRCWGLNDHGQLGNGQASERPQQQGPSVVQVERPGADAGIH